MRLLLEAFLVAALLWLGWTQSFRDQFNHLRGIEPTPQQQAVQVRQATAVTAAQQAAPRQPFYPAYRKMVTAPTPSGDWMWDPNHRNPLDRGATKTNSAPAPSEAPQANYWIDARGVKHPYNATPSP